LHPSDTLSFSASTGSHLSWRGHDEISAHTARVVGEMLASIAGVRVASGCAPASASDHSPIIDHSFHARQQMGVVLTKTAVFDLDINTSDTSIATYNQISDPITQTHTRQINNQISSFLASYSSYLDNESTHSVLLLRNDGQ
jgi:hypothetical protein